MSAKVIRWARWPRSSKPALGRAHAIVAVGKGETPDGTIIDVVVLACAEVRPIAPMTLLPEKPEHNRCEKCDKLDKLRNGPRASDDVPEDAPVTVTAFMAAPYIDTPSTPVEVPVGACLCGSGGCDRGGVREIRLARELAARNGFEAYLAQKGAH